MLVEGSCRSFVAFEVLTAVVIKMHLLGYNAV
jgi:hypothetical protein